MVIMFLNKDAHIRRSYINDEENTPKYKTHITHEKTHTIITIYHYIDMLKFSLLVRRSDELPGLYNKSI